jgi:hypothetical protein
LLILQDLKLFAIVFMSSNTIPFLGTPTSWCQLGEFYRDINIVNQPVPVTHTCNSSCSGGRNQDDGGSKPAQANSLRDPISKNPSQKRDGRVAQGEGPEFKPQYCKKKKKEKK